MASNNSTAPLDAQLGSRLVILGVFTSLYVLCSWQCDDAYITVRSIDNFFNGHGLRWNVAERVQGYTHPLWMMLLALGRWLTGEFYFSIYLMSFLCGLAALGMAMKIFRDNIPQQIFLAVLLFCSRAFMDFTSSGLENPLSYLLLVAFFVNLFKVVEDQSNLTWPRLAGQSLVLALSYLTRPDSILLLVLPLGWQYWRSRSLGLRKLALAAALGLAPAILWSAAALVYYGFFLPNTFYAKLSLGLPWQGLFRQGLAYIFYAITFDILTPSVIVIGILLSLASGNVFLRLVGLSLVLHLYYVVSIGGDFMAGRFLTLTFLSSALVVTRLVTANPARIMVAALAVAVCVINPHSPIKPYKGINSTQDVAGIIDERAFYYDATSLCSISQRQMGINHPFAKGGQEARAKGKHVSATTTVGMSGFKAGPDVHVIDLMALTDPLLARLPVQAHLHRGFRIGHFLRDIPSGYPQSLERDQNLLTDGSLREYYEKIRVVTRGPLFTQQRWFYIWQLNFTSQAKYK